MARSEREAIAEHERLAELARLEQERLAEVGSEAYNSFRQGPVGLDPQYCSPPPLSLKPLHAWTLKLLSISGLFQEEISYFDRRGKKSQ